MTPDVEPDHWVCYKGEGTVTCYEIYACERSLTLDCVKGNYCRRAQTDYKTDTMACIQGS